MTNLVLVKMLVAGGLGIATASIFFGLIEALR